MHEAQVYKIRTIMQDYKILISAKFINKCFDFFMCKTDIIQKN